jgi:hypothetical protein
MHFLRWAFAGALIVAFCFLHAQQQTQVAISVPVPDIARRIDFSRTSCGSDGDFVAWLNAGPEDLPHELVHIGANGSLMAHFDLRWTPGFGNATIKDAALDSSGKILLLVQNVMSSGPQEPGHHGQQGGMWWRTDPTSWIVTLDNSGRLLSKFSFDQRLAPSQFSLFRSRNLLIAGYLRTQEINGPGAVIFAPSGAALVTLKLPVAEEMDGVAKIRPLPGPGDEVFMAHLWTDPYLMKISEDGTVQPKVMLTVPKDELASVQKISGHRAIAFREAGRAATRRNNHESHAMATLRRVRHRLRRTGANAARSTVRGGPSMLFRFGKDLHIQLEENTGFHRSKDQQQAVTINSSVVRHPFLFLSQ